MKFGVSYNVFDGFEHLENSIKQIRNKINFISVVYQKKSNFGNDADIKLEIELKELVSKKLIDCIYEYDPDLEISAHENEIIKRNIGYFLSLENNCDYHMSMDCDEYYLKDDINFLIEDYKKNKYNSGFCKMKTYYHDNNIIINPPEEYYVSLFYKTNLNKTYVLGNKLNISVDPTRIINYSDNIKIYERDEIEMQHLSYVRNNITEKFNNSSAKTNFKNIEYVVNYFNKWSYPEKALLMGVDNKYYDVLRFDKLKNEISENIL